jgi:hypothetical protein
MIKRLITKLRFLILGFIFLSVLSCGNPEKEIYRLTENPESLITNDSIKVWKIAKRMNNGYRMNMGYCFLEYRLSFTNDMIVKDNNGDSEDCGNSLEANWSLFSNDNGDFIKYKSESLKQLMNIEEDFKFFRILHLSSDSLVVTYKHKQYSNNSLTIIDYYVPEDRVVKDRDFNQ